MRPEIDAIKSAIQFPLVEAIRGLRVIYDRLLVVPRRRVHRAA